MAIQFPQNLSKHLIICFTPLSSGLLHCLVNWNTIRDLLKMGTIKDRNGMDLTEAEDIKKRWKEYTEELYKKDLYKNYTKKNYTKKIFMTQITTMV